MSAPPADRRGTESQPAHPASPARPATVRNALAWYTAAAVPARWADAGAGTALALLALDRTGSAGLAGLLVGALELPHALAAPVVGALADRSRSPRRFYTGALLVFAVGLAAVALTLGRLPFAVAAVGALVAGTAGPLLTGGLSGVLSGLVPAEQRSRAYALDAATYNVAGVAAPAAVAALGIATSLTWATVGLAAVVAAGALPLAAVPFLSAADAAGERGRLSGVFVRVVRVVWTRPRLRGATVATTLSHAGVGGLTLAVTLVAVGTGASTAAGGVLMSGYALGALAGSLAMRWLPVHRIDAFTVLLVSMTVHGIALVPVAFAANVPLAVGLLAVAGCCDGPLLATTLTVRGEETPPELRAEVFSTTASLKITAAAAGAAALGGLAGLGGTTLVLLIAASQLLAAGVGWCARGGRGAVGGGGPPDQARPEGSF